MRIGVVGLGYVGLVTAAVLADKKNEVIGIDIDPNKINLLKRGKPTIFEPGLKTLLRNPKLKFSTDYNDLKGMEAIFVSVQTPNKNGRIDTSYVLNAVSKIKKINRDTVLIIKSTVSPGTTKKLAEITGMKVAFNPEFTKEGSAVNDTLKQDRIVIGAEDDKIYKFVEKIWSFTNAPVIETSFVNAEFIKYASNSFLAAKIAFINSLAEFAGKFDGFDIDIIAKGMGADPRISPYFLKAGMGYGGSCFPKDTLAIVAEAKNLGIELPIIKSAIDVNEKILEKIIRHIKNYNKNLKGIKIGVLGIAFKAGTDDTRESQSIKLMNLLAKRGAILGAYDPLVKTKMNKVRQFDTIDECIKASDVVIVANDSDEFKNIEPMLKDKFVIDVYRKLNAKKLKSIVQIGRNVN